MELKPIEHNFKYTPHIFLLSSIFFFKYFTKAKEINKNHDKEKLSNANRIYYKYLFCFQLAKAADWCLGPFMYEFFETYQLMKPEMVAKLMALSFAASLFMGPLIVGYLNDKADKKLPCMIFGFSLALSCLIRLIKNPGALIMAQVAYGLCSPLLYTSFENWFVTQAKNKIEDKDIREEIISNAFEKYGMEINMNLIFKLKFYFILFFFYSSLMIDGLMASGVSIITGSLKVKIKLNFYINLLISLKKFLN
jgi:hypothetical protein